MQKIQETKIKIFFILMEMGLDHFEQVLNTPQFTSILTTLFQKVNHNQI